MITAKQIVIQLTTAPIQRMLVQYGENEQQEVDYSELTADEKITFDNFVNLANSKIPQL